MLLAVEFKLFIKWFLKLSLSISLKPGFPLVRSVHLTTSPSCSRVANFFYNSANYTFGHLPFGRLYRRKHLTGPKTFNYNQISFSHSCVERSESFELSHRIFGTFF
jgi:hypothetical protein